MPLVNERAGWGVDRWTRWTSGWVDGYMGEYIDMWMDGRINYEQVAGWGDINPQQGHLRQAPDPVAAVG